jgi:hypothetical protein
MNVFVKTTQNFMPKPLEKKREKIGIVLLGNPIKLLKTYFISCEGKIQRTAYQR